MAIYDYGWSLSTKASYVIKYQNKREMYKNDMAIYD